MENRRKANVTTRLEMKIMTSVLHLTPENYEAAVTGKVALLDFWAEWCGPCRMLGGVIEQVAAEAADDVTVAKVNVDEAMELAKKFNVRNLPAIFLLKNGEIVKQFTGIQDKQTLLNAIKSA